MSPNVITLTSASFDETVNSASSPVIIDFWAEWCGPCKQIAPILDELADDYAGDLIVAKLNVDENPEVVTRYSVLSIPTMLVFNNGELVNSIVGAKPKSALVEELGEFLPSR